ncbi:hypothetical protein TYRP_022207 [Tyrophagus putrescentiae]|nr:hypothetical protein TYRP_022207 [Tyrophagus putrescentiae]
MQVTTTAAAAAAVFSGEANRSGCQLAFHFFLQDHRMRCLNSVGTSSSPSSRAVPGLLLQQLLIQLLGVVLGQEEVIRGAVPVVISLSPVLRLLGGGRRQGSLFRCDHPLVGVDESGQQVPLLLFAQPIKGSVRHHPQFDSVVFWSLSGMRCPPSSRHRRVHSTSNRYMNPRYSRSRPAPPKPSMSACQFQVFGILLLISTTTALAQDAHHDPPDKVWASKDL